MFKEIYCCICYNPFNWVEFKDDWVKKGDPSLLQSPNSRTLEKGQHDQTSQLRMKYRHVSRIEEMKQIGLLTTCASKSLRWILFPTQYMHFFNSPSIVAAEFEGFFPETETSPAPA